MIRTIAAVALAAATSSSPLYPASFHKTEKFSMHMTQSAGNSLIKTTEAPVSIDMQYTVDHIDARTVHFQGSAFAQGRNVSVGVHLDRETEQLTRDDGAPTNSPVTFLYNPDFWGSPSDLKAGATWQKHVPAWAFAGDGTVTVKIESVDAAKHDAVLIAHGHSDEPGLEEHAQSVQYSTRDKQYDAQIVPGSTDWTARLEIRDGVLVHQMIRAETVDHITGTPIAPKRDIKAWREQQITVSVG